MYGTTVNSVVAFLNRQQYGALNNRWKIGILQRLSVRKSDFWHGIVALEELYDGCAPGMVLAAKFAKCQNDRNILAVADGDGMVRYLIAFSLSI